MSKFLQLLSFVFVPILLTSSGEFVLKHELNNLTITPDFQGLLQLITSPFIVLSVSLIVCGGLLWLVAMTKFQISYIYPFLSLNYVIIFLGSGLILGEEIPLKRAIALTLVVLGLLVISKSPHLESK